MVRSLVGHYCYNDVGVDGGSVRQSQRGVCMLGCTLSSPVGFGPRLGRVDNIIIGSWAGQQCWTHWSAVRSMNLAILRGISSIRVWWSRWDSRVMECVLSAGIW